MQQDKEVLALKGQFKSKGGLNSPVTKSKFLQTGLSKWVTLLFDSRLQYFYFIDC